MAKEMYLVSFGNSSKYVTSSGETIKKITDKIAEGVEKVFPSMDKSKIPEPTVEKLPEGADCSSYQELDLKAIPAIVKSLVTGKEDAASVKELNSNAPWDKLNPFK